MPPSSRRQRRRSGGLTGAALACLVAVVALALAPAASAAPPPQISLKITSGSVTTSNGKVKGSATVGNSGAPVHERFFVDLIVQLNGPDRRLRRTSVPRLDTGAAKIVRYNQNLPDNLPIGRHQIWACVGHSGSLPEPSVLIGCREVGGVNVPVPRLIPTPAAPAPQPPSQQQSPAPTPTPAPTAGVSAPIAYQAGVPMVLNDAGANYYWVDVPASYDPSNGTPTKLFVWLPSCGGAASQDISTVSPATVAGSGAPRDWISIAVGERNDECWNPNTDGSLVTNAIADVETHFNVDPHRVILGGYAEGGSLAYRLAFYDADQFAGLLAENTQPFANTGSTESASLAAAAWKFNVVHLAHLQDSVYPIAQVRQETEAMINAGFPLTRIERNGEEFEEPGTYADLVTFLLPNIDDGWTSP